jgi:hypothetical protein
MLTLERGLDTGEVLGMVVALSELTGVAGILSVMAGDSSLPIQIQLSMRWHQVESSLVVGSVVATS